MELKLLTDVSCYVPGHNATHHEAGETVHPVPILADTLLEYGLATKDRRVKPQPDTPQSATVVLDVVTNLKTPTRRTKKTPSGLADAHISIWAA